MGPIFWFTSLHLIYLVGKRVLVTYALFCREAVVNKPIEYRLSPY